MLAASPKRSLDEVLLAAFASLSPAEELLTAGDGAAAAAGLADLWLKRMVAVGRIWFRQFVSGQESLGRLVVLAIAVRHLEWAPPHSRKEQANRRCRESRATVAMVNESPTYPLQKTELKRRYA